MEFARGMSSEVFAGGESAEGVGCLPGGGGLRTERGIRRGATPPVPIYRTWRILHVHRTSNLGQPLFNFQNNRLRQFGGMACHGPTDGQTDRQTTPNLLPHSGL